MLISRQVFTFLFRYLFSLTSRDIKHFFLFCYIFFIAFGELFGELSELFGELFGELYYTYDTWYRSYIIVRDYRKNKYKKVTAHTKVKLLFCNLMLD